MKEPAQQTILFDTLHRGRWIKKICEVQKEIPTGKYDNCEIDIILPDNITHYDIQAVHIVTLACLVQELKKKCNIKGRITGPQEVIDYFKDSLHLSDYFRSQVAHKESNDSYHLNLWRIDIDHILMYSAHVASYLKRVYFEGKDLSGLKVILDELYANIADHACAKGIAYSFIQYDSFDQEIRVAFCDFGIGIEASLRKGKVEFSENFIKTATEKGISSKSNIHNKGFGLDIVVSAIQDSGGTIRFLSGNELFVCSGPDSSQKTISLSISFCGTLVYFNYPVNFLDEEDILKDFEFLQ